MTWTHSTRSRVVCCPVANGGGTRLKLIGAAAHAKPIVATPVGAEGLIFENKLEILICDADSRIAQGCIRLLTDDAMALQLGGRLSQGVLSLRDRRNQEKESARVSERPGDVLLQVAV